MKQLYNLNYIKIDRNKLKYVIYYFQIEEFGKPIAWKMDSNLAILLETDLINFTKLLMTSFLRDRLIINDNLPLIRIECKLPC